MAAARLVIFDVDGTLVDSQCTIVEAQRRTLAALGLPAPSRETALSVIGLSLAEAFTVLVGPRGPVPALVEGYKRAWLELRGEPGFAEPLYPGAAEIVAELAATPGTVLGLATGKSRRGVDRFLDTHGLRSLFATTQTADEHPSKPDPSMLLQALAETGVPAAAAVFVGDTSFDMDAARAAAIRGIGVAWGYQPVADLRDAGAAAIAADFADLRRLLASVGADPAREDQSGRAPRNPVAST